MNDADYQARFRPTVKDAFAFAGSLGFVAIGLSLLDIAPVAAVPAIAFFGCCALGVVVVAIRQWGRPALRVDGKGVLLGRLAFQGPRSGLFVPWSKIGFVVLFRQQVWPIRLLYLGLDGKGRPIDTPVPRGFGSFGASLIPHVPPWVVAVSRPVTGWSLDRPALERALVAHAPEVRLVDLG